MKELKPCRNCGSSDAHLWAKNDAVECNACSHTDDLETWQADTGREKIYLARAERAEAERDVLAEALAWGAGKENRSVFAKLPWCDSKRKWLEWAVQEVAKKKQAEFLSTYHGVDV